jgi:PPK2 family polyphosphate:nucleotide phosphotransferase
MNFDKLLAPPGKSIKLKDYPTANGTDLTKVEAAEKLESDVKSLADLQTRLAAQNTYALLVILQGIDAAGKDGTIKHVMSGLNPAGCQVTSFKVPSEEELDHDYLWRYAKAIPPRGNIGIFNRSYYEEVLVVRVHPALLERQRIPGKKSDKFWASRYEEINEFERYLVRNGIEVMKFFLHLSKEEQKKRFLDRLDSPEKHWKFSAADVKERAYWDDYAVAFEDMLSHTSTEVAPWHVIPADQKWFARLAVANFIARKLESLKLKFPTLDAAGKQALAESRKSLEAEK